MVSWAGVDRRPLFQPFQREIQSVILWFERETHRLLVKLDIVYEMRCDRRVEAGWIGIGL
eukprot:10733170-Lingulodinium_polyedra.AAC.1